MLKAKVTGNEYVKIVFRAYLHQKWIDIYIYQTKIKMITDPFYSVSQKNPTCGFVTFFPKRMGIF